MRRFGRAVVCAFGLVVIAAQAPAQTYPSKPVRIIVPYAPGGLTDVVARLYAEQLRQRFGHGVFVENKPGAFGSIIAIEEMARARPDGHTKGWLREEMASWKRDVEDVGIVVEE